MEEFRKPPDQLVIRGCLDQGDIRKYTEEVFETIKEAFEICKTEGCTEVRRNCPHLVVYGRS